MRRRPPFLLAFPLAAALVLSACGGGSKDTTGLLPGKTADQIVENLNRVESAYQQGNCERAAQYADDVVSQVEGLPQSVKPQLRNVLSRGADRLQGRVATTCQQTATQPTTPLTTESTTQPSTTEPTTTSTKETTQQTTTQETTTQPTTTQSTPTTTQAPPPTTPPPTTGGGGGSGGIGPGGVAPNGGG
jgi:cell division protein FtsN